jgi:Fe-Mn family superoxide dismutase
MSGIIQERLPYAENGLEPYISAKTMSFHYGKHHAAYVNKANELLKGSDLEGKSPEEIMKAVVRQSDKAAIFNNVAQAWNHAFFWKCLKPGGGGMPAGKFADMINGSFGDFATFKKDFVNAAVTQFGSGWAWLVQEGGKFKLMKTSNADTPVAHGVRPLFTVDVWEHAYYLDYQNRRPDFVQAVLERLANWDFVAAQMK